VPLTERGETSTPTTQYKVAVSLADTSMAAGATMSSLSAQASAAGASIGQVLVLRAGS
jgi:hypothetical protein